jgi:hypothetical protein
MLGWMGSAKVIDTNCVVLAAAPAARPHETAAIGIIAKISRRMSSSFLRGTD